MSKSWAKGSTTAWRKTRASVLRRDRGVCQLRVPGVCTTRADQVHHTKGRAVTGDDPKYLVASCRACNLHVGQPGSRSPKHLRITSW